MRNRSLLTVLATAALLPALAAPALATDRDHRDRGNAERYQARLDPVPHDPRADSGSDVRGFAKLVEVDGELRVQVKAYGLSPLLPHLMHIHGELEARNECPGPEFRAGGVNDQLIETVDGLPAYGPIQVTFSTEGDTSAAAGLNLDTAPVADRKGRLSYQRVLLDVPDELLDELDDLHIVIHGEDLDDDGMYDPEPITALGAPLEAELPVACGELEDRDKKNRGHGHGKGHDKGHGHG
ncbi:hypothetical protein [Blastococcus xanthinilyticus]|uniref:CHRD domain-containing protein n=1 Tax=Blastococcus xanthinilyticus TaxID=1564164 RepID=A0A5S5CXH4_9ACTN|nr:hypothetical protein [Blastococcus xanthinilyticus]TYP88501.1 hypothetical protein BD833_104206 [Blastococcus xanthinilyticus]